MNVKRYAKATLAAFLLTGVPVAGLGCHTVRGAGQDVASAGRSMQRVATKNENKMERRQAERRAERRAEDQARQQVRQNYPVTAPPPASTPPPADAD